MKLYLSINKKPLNGYLNLSPISQYEETKPCDLKNLDHYVDRSSLKQIIAEDVIGYIEVENLLDTLRHWVSKLRLNGELVITGIDMYEVCREVLNQNINIPTANKILYGEHQHSWNFRISTVTLYDVVSLLNELGLKIMEKKLEGINYCIKSRRVN